MSQLPASPLPPPTHSYTLSLPPSIAKTAPVSPLPPSTTFFPSTLFNATIRGNLISLYSHNSSTHYTISTPSPPTILALTPTTLTILLPGHLLQLSIPTFDLTHESNTPQVLAVPNTTSDDDILLGYGPEIVVFNGRNTTTLPLPTKSSWFSTATSDDITALTSLSPTTLLAVRVTSTSAYLQHILTTPTPTVSTQTPLPGTADDQYTITAHPTDKTLFLLIVTGTDTTVYHGVLSTASSHPILTPILPNATPSALISYDTTGSIVYCYERDSVTIVDVNDVTKSWEKGIAGFEEQGESPFVKREEVVKDTVVEGALPGFYSELVATGPVRGGGGREVWCKEVRVTWENGGVTIEGFGGGGDTVCIVYEGGGGEREVGREVVGVEERVRRVVWEEGEVEEAVGGGRFRGPVWEQGGPGRPRLMTGKELQTLADNICNNSNLPQPHNSHALLTTPLCHALFLGAVAAAHAALSKLLPVIGERNEGIDVDPDHVQTLVSLVREKEARLIGFTSGVLENTVAYLCRYLPAAAGAPELLSCLTHLLSHGRTQWLIPIVCNPLAFDVSVVLLNEVVEAGGVQWGLERGVAMVKRGQPGDGVRGVQVVVKEIERRVSGLEEDEAKKVLMKVTGLHGAAPGTIEERASEYLTALPAMRSCPAPTASDAAAVARMSVVADKGFAGVKDVYKRQQMALFLYKVAHLTLLLGEIPDPTLASGVALSILALTDGTPLFVERGNVIGRAFAWNLQLENFATCHDLTLMNHEGTRVREQFKRLCVRMVEKGLRGELMGKALGVKECSDGSTIDLYETAVSALQVKAAETLAASDVNWSEALYELHACRSDWRRAAGAAVGAEGGSYSEIMAVHALQSVEQEAHRFIVDPKAEQEARSSHVLGVDELRVRALVARASERLEESGGRGGVGSAEEAFDRLCRCGFFSAALDLNMVKWGEFEAEMNANLAACVQHLVLICGEGSRAVEGVNYLGSDAIVERFVDGFVGYDEIEIYGEEYDVSDRVKSAAWCCLRKLIKVYGNAKNGLALLAGRLQLEMNEGRGDLPHWLQTLLLGQGVDSNARALMLLYTHFGKLEEALGVCCDVLRGGGAGGAEEKKKRALELTPERGGVEYVPYNSVDLLFEIAENRIREGGGVGEEGLRLALSDAERALREHFQVMQAGQAAELSARALQK